VSKRAASCGNWLIDAGLCLYDPRTSCRYALPQAEQNVILLVLDDEVDGDQRCIADDTKKFVFGQEARRDHQQRAKPVIAQTQISIKCMATASNFWKSRLPLVRMNCLFKEKRRASEFIVLDRLAAAPIASIDRNPFAHGRRIS
jgi:hypothetical protein